MLAAFSVKVALLRCGYPGVLSLIHLHPAESKAISAASSADALSALGYFGFTDMDGPGIEPLPQPPPGVCTPQSQRVVCNVDSVRNSSFRATIVLPACDVSLWLVASGKTPPIAHCAREVVA